MIEFENVRKTYRLSGVEKVILNDLSFAFPAKTNVAILGHNGAGKSTIMRLIAGAELPDRGRIHRKARVSWPLGFTGGFGGDMTGLENARFVARMYGEDSEAVVAFVEEFSELGPSMRLPIRTYSSGMRARLAFGVSMAIDFDYYLIDEITAVGDTRFKKKCDAVFETKLEKANIIMISHSIPTIRKFCESACLLDKGELSYFENVEDAIDRHEHNQSQ
ncbi:ABC transporter ATP-binding protein [Stappia indica]|uniref:ABC transporter ATP-binding protein n=1 Tax=Stappia indica TaxID=538381 RepID=UPI001CD5B89A|nr:ABC transporter ATP-binding protein [Stappia indica]MCA1299385.1 ABC transporter ATP-binding protein [Stappia indica]